MLFPQGCTNPSRQVAVAINFFFKMAHNICGFPVWKLLHVTPLAPGILRCLLEFWEIRALLVF